MDVTSADGSVIDASALSALFDVLHERGYSVVGPTVRDGAIELAELDTADELPYGWGVRLEAGSYRLRRRNDSAAFCHAAGPQSWKTFLHPPRERLWSADAGQAPEPEPQPRKRYAFIGVRPCDLQAIAILDGVLAGGAHPDEAYTGRRDGVFVVAVECTEPGETCFCASMGAGPGAEAGFDLALTELVDADGRHRLVVRTGTDVGAEVLAAVPSEPATDELRDRARREVADAVEHMGRSMPVDGLHELIAGSRGSARWDEIANRCLTCGNCTMVCPTCFCTTTEDITDLTGEHAERWQRWDSCFDIDFSYMHGGAIRTSGASRYRQWLSHKLGTWHDQFGSSGCVGCGRCIVWCPVGIDLTEEVAALRAEAEGS